jgi:hypothetical protein
MQWVRPVKATGQVLNHTMEEGDDVATLPGLLLPNCYSFGHVTTAYVESGTTIAQRDPYTNVVTDSTPDIESKWKGPDHFRF